MSKPKLIRKLVKRNPELNLKDSEEILEIFTKCISQSLLDCRNIELRGFGTISKKSNKEKYVRNPKTNEKIFKEKTYKLHFKIGKTLHNRINLDTNNDV